MKAIIDGRGFFVYTISGLAVGDPAFIENKFNRMKLGDLYRFAETICEAGFARCSRTGWWTIDHPDLGVVSFKFGRDFRTTRKFLLLRLGGQMILKAWPSNDPARPLAEWVAPAAAKLSVSERSRVEHWLGSL